MNQQQQQQMNMAAMGAGGPVGGPHMNHVGTPRTNHNTTPETMMVKLNTAIYDYLLRNEWYGAAKEMHNAANCNIDYKDTKPSPSQRGQQPNGGDDSMEIDSKDPGLLHKPDDLPLPVNVGGDGPFLQDWWCQFWDMWAAHRNRGSSPGAMGSYMNQQRLLSMQRGNNMLGLNQQAMAANGMRGFNPMMQNGMANDMRKNAINNNQRVMNPAQIAQMNNRQAAGQNGQMMQPGNPMERSNSQMDNRSGSPGSGDAPSPKRQRTDGGMQQMNQGRPGQPGQMPPNNQVGSPSIAPPPDDAFERARALVRDHNQDPDLVNQAQLYRLSNQPTNCQEKAVEMYSQSIHRQMSHALHTVEKPESNVNKVMQPNMGPGGQGSPMSQQGMDGPTGDFYNGAAANGGARMQMPGNPGAAGAAGQGNGNHALQDYQMQLMLLEQQNKKRLLMARQEQDSLTGNPNAHAGGAGPNAQFQPGSPSGAHMMDPNLPAQMRQQMAMGPNGMARPPSSHPGGNMGPSQMEMMQRGMAPNGPFPPGPPQGQMMPGQPGGPANGIQGTPRQASNNMPPPPAPAANAGGTGPSSPSQQPQPPTPSTTNKPKPGTKKENAKKGAAAKKNAANANAATESEHPPTPTPATPITPQNVKSFNNPNGQQMPNGQPAMPNQNNGPANNQLQNSNAVPQPDPNTSLEPFGSLDGTDQFNNMDLSLFQSDNGDVLDNFDFDSFLNNDSEGLGFDASFAFDGNPIGNGIEGA